MREEERPMTPEIKIMRAAAVMAPAKTLTRECFMARIVVTMNVRSPSSEARTARKEAKKGFMVQDHTPDPRLIAGGERSGSERGVRSLYHLLLQMRQRAWTSFPAAGIVSLYHTLLVTM